MARMTATERRTQLLEIATREFARKGFHGTSVETIARRADIAQPYVFQLFGSKKVLFGAVVTRCFEQVNETFAEHAAGLTGSPALRAMGDAYQRLLTDQTFLLIQLHGFAACDDPDIRETVRTGFKSLWTTAQELSGLEDANVQRFLSMGMLLNAAAAMDLASLHEPWAEACLAPPVLD
ncbi:TetR/AcrR family transcriptional regulator [Actinomadura sp. 9N215]|uniref:TetR/AcrR family transcriptional regulator n=1 Tax=Actinomadura sp. 9N215 TaxID=3375150 RepID=UPI0037A3DF9C